MKTAVRAALDSHQTASSVSPDGKMLHFNRQFLDVRNLPAEIVESDSAERALEWAARRTANPAAFLERVGKIYQQPDTDECARRCR